MEYTISWLDATLQSNGFPINTANTQFTLAQAQSDGWFDYSAIHTFKANTNKKAIEYAKNYDFDGRYVEVFNLSKDNKVIATEENI